MDQRTSELFLDLPRDLHRRVASFLAMTDAVNMTKSCRRLHDNLAMTHLVPGRRLVSDYRREGDYYKGNNFFRGFRIPIFNQRVHSVRLECMWKDQGWGNRKTECRVVGYPSGSTIPSEVGPPRKLALKGGRTVCESGLAEHDETRLTLTFNPREGEDYVFYYKVGCGGGHQLFMRDLVLHTVIFDDDKRHSYFLNNYRNLFEKGLLCKEVDDFQTKSVFSSNLLLCVARTLRKQLEDEDGDQDIDAKSSTYELVSFLAEHSIPTTRGSLMAMEEILQADMNERTKES